MGQKVHPVGFRLGVIKKHNALWYAKGKSYKENLIEDLKVRDFIKNRLRFSSISKVDLERSAQNFVVNIKTMLFGGGRRSGSDVHLLPHILSTFPVHHELHTL